ncbi:MAG: SDR family oxidoreductase [Desulfobacteraceae bacterium]|nr:SDR family oxidoreductase [Desulfobacteraceae bacterium]
MENYQKKLAGKTTLVTGAGRGIGKAIAVSYAKAGAVVSCASRTYAEIEETVREIEAAGRQGLAIQADVTELPAVRNMFRTAADAFGGLDIVVIAAGDYFEDKTVEESDPELWHASISVNLMGAYYCAKTAVPYLRERGGGKIIMIGSGLGHRGRPRTSAYACAKAGLWTLTRVLAQEVLQYNISVNELIPGPVRTNLTADVLAQSGGTPRIAGEWAKTPEDVVPLALFLAEQPLVGPTAQSFSLMRRDS